MKGKWSITIEVREAKAGGTGVDFYVDVPFGGPTPGSERIMEVLAGVQAQLAEEMLLGMAAAADSKKVVASTQ